MSDEPKFDDLGADSDPVGSMETRKLQSLGRVDIPDEFLEQIDSKEGQKILVICEEDQIVITKATKDKVFRNGK